ncbi:hypothetical protein [Planctomyces sp. SH-PL62]|uniref:hypothetical protein n=1 Tax=Planctomyces sp. SH-PL62 TaxID=1636152 RepID=UPI0008381E79|nr:hypothetical protein [Planctomyces sp. SH-PL62]
MVALIMASLGGAMHLVISVHRRALTARKATEPPTPTPIAATAVPVAPEPTPAPAPLEIVETPPKVVEKPRPAPSPPPEDPTPKALAQLNEATAREAEEAARLDREVRSLEQGRQAAVAESERWRRREMLVQQQVAALAKKAEKLDRQVDAYAAQRDVLARERDALKAALANAPSEGSYAVLPYRGENGTWRRPIVIECTAGSVQIRPDGPSFSLLDLSGWSTRDPVRSSWPSPASCSRSSPRPPRTGLRGSVFRLPGEARRHPIVLRGARPA